MPAASALATTIGRGKGKSSSVPGSVAQLRGSNLPMASDSSLARANGRQRLGLAHAIAVVPLGLRLVLLEPPILAILLSYVRVGN